MDNSRVETEEDVKAILFAIPNFLGHRIPILNKEYDYLVRKTITLECPELIFDVNWVYICHSF